MLSLLAMANSNDRESRGSGGLLSLGDILKKMVDQPTKRSGPFREIRIWEEWSKVVGVKIAKQTQLQKFEAGRLYVGAQHPAWVTELSFRSEELRERLNAALGREVVNEIVFRLDQKRRPT